ncbi:MAG: YciI family protein [Emcibacter sp.]|nr:YciI family protein [Emcibacter sp.]
MHFIILAEDKPNSLDLRLASRPDHLDYANKRGCVMLAGPLLTEGSEPKPRGSMLIIDVKDKEAAKDFAANDPYAKAGLFVKVDILPWMPAINAWITPKT